MAAYTHPLSSLVMASFVDESCQDALKVASYLGAPFDSKALQAYRIVAEDVLEVLRGQGFLVLDRDGWYRSTVGEQLGG